MGVFIPGYALFQETTSGHSKRLPEQRTWPIGMWLLATCCGIPVATPLTIGAET